MLTSASRNAVCGVCFAALAIVGCARQEPNSSESPVSPGSEPDLESRTKLQTAGAGTYQVAFDLPPQASMGDVVLVANGQLNLTDGVILQSQGGSARQISNLGANGTHIGVEAQLGTVLSSSQVTVADRATINGDIVTNQPVVLGNQVHITGDVITDATFTPHHQIAWTVTYPSTSQGTVSLEPNQQRSIGPGRWSDLIVKAGAVLTVRSGTYYVDNLDLEPSSQLKLNQSAGPVVIYLRTSLIYRGRIVVIGGAASTLTMVCLGAGSISVEGSFDGNLIAPNASLTLATVSGGHTGTFIARNLTVNAHTTIRHRVDASDCDFDGLSFSEEVDHYGTNPFVADTDGDGLKDGEEVAYWSSRGDGISWNSDVEIIGAEQATGKIGDGLINLLDPDSDNDGLLDGVEVHGWNMPIPDGMPIHVDSDPAKHDSDGDGLLDKVEYDGWSIKVAGAARHVYANPRLADSDGDTLSDFAEANRFFSDPLSTHTFDAQYRDQDRANNLTVAGPSALDPECTLYAQGNPEYSYVTHYKVQSTITTPTFEVRSVRQLYVEKGMINRPFTVHFRSETADDPTQVDLDDTFSAIEYKRPGSDTFAPAPGGSGPFAGSHDVPVTPDANKYGFYEFRLVYHMDNDLSKYHFYADFDDDKSLVPLAWTDPEIAAHVEVSFIAAGGKPIYLRGGAYGDGTDAATSYITEIHLDGSKMYERSFNGADFEYPLGTLAGGPHELSFDWQLSNSGLGKLMTHICESGLEWNPVQITYMASMHTRDYGAWKTGIAAVPGGVGLQDAVVRRDTTFLVVGHWVKTDSGTATVEIYKDNVFQTGWTTSPKEKYQGREGYFFHNVEVSVPPNIAIGKYTLRMFDGSHNQVGAEVPFNVIFNPYRLVNGDTFTKAHLETFAYDEDEDGSDWGVDSDHGRDDWTAFHLTAGSDPTKALDARTYQLHAFVPRELETGATETSVFELALAAADGSVNEFDAGLRLFRLMNQRITWTKQWNKADIDEMLGDNYTNDPEVRLTPDDARRFSRNNEDLYTAYPKKRINGQCNDFAAGLIGLARSLGIPARHVAEPGGFDWGFHSWSEVYLPGSLLPKQDGTTASGGTTNSDRDSWYVFDSTDSYQDPTIPSRWPHSEEAIDPRVDFYASFVSNGANAPGAIYVSRLDWCIPGSGLSCDYQGESVLSDYATPTDFWMSGAAGSSVSGWLSWGDKDIFRVNLPAASTVSLSASADLDIVLCAYDHLPTTEHPLDKCPDASSSKALAAGSWVIQVFNRSAHDGTYGGNYVRYTLAVN